MALMTSQHWKDQTRRGVLTPRSKTLEAIDKAFLAYDDAKKKSGQTTKAQTDLFKALIAWIETKGTDWRTSTRNSKIEAGGKGTVETLLNQLIDLNPAFRGEGAKFLSQNAPPPPPLMQLGARNTQKDVDGGWHEIPIQTQKNSCGPCSIRLVIKLVQNKDVGEDFLRDLVEMAEEGGAFGGSLGRGGVVISGGAHDWSPSGGGTWLVPAALAAVRPEIAISNSTNPDDLLRTTKKRPAIAVVSWSGGGMHYVVAAGPNRNGDQLIVLDPFYGVQAAPIGPTGLGNYQPVDSAGTVLATATWYNWVCKVN
jgi:hypothetical protein